MIPRRIAEHVKAHNWFAVGIDFVIVVVGVFVGIQVSNWNAARQDHARAEKFLERIHAALLTDVEGVDRRLAYWGKVQDYGAAALAYAEEGRMKNGSAWETLLAFYQASQVWTYSPADATYREMTAAGELGLLPDALRDGLASYYDVSQRNAAIYQHFPAYREKIRGLTPSRIQSRIWDECHRSLTGDRHEFVECKDLAGEPESRAVIDGFAAQPDLVADLRFWMTNIRVISILAALDQRDARELADRVEGETAR
jgi:hypothetical protein